MSGSGKLVALGCDDIRHVGLNGAPLIPLRRSDISRAENLYGFIFWPLRTTRIPVQYLMKFLWCQHRSVGKRSGWSRGARRPSRTVLDNVHATRTWRRRLRHDARRQHWHSPVVHWNDGLVVLFLVKLKLNFFIFIQPDSIASGSVPILWGVAPYV